MGHSNLVFCLDAQLSVIIVMLCLFNFLIVAAILHVRLFEGILCFKCLALGFITASQIIFSLVLVLHLFFAECLFRVICNIPVLSWRLKLLSHFFTCCWQSLCFIDTCHQFCFKTWVRCVIEESIIIYLS